MLHPILLNHSSLVTDRHLPLEKQHYAIELGGIGIDVGEVTLETPSGHFFDVQPPRNSHVIEPHTVAS